MRRSPAQCAGGCGRPVRKRRGAKWCSPCITRKPKVVCRTCGEAFAIDMVVGRRCKPCMSKASHEKRVGETYGLAPGDYARLLEHQGGACFICQRRPGLKRLAVDHDHSCCAGPISCGQCVRGLLCRNCNRDVLGHLKDDPASLRRAIEYVESPPAKEVLG